MHRPFAPLVGDVLLECLHPLIQTVISKNGEVNGPYRTYDFDVVAGRNNTQVKLVENGAHLTFDLRDVYWCSRLGQERRRLLSTFEDGQWIVDAFCGVGSLCIQAAASYRNCTIFANDWNPEAIHALKLNAKRNHVRLAKVECRDAYDFLMDLGLHYHKITSRGGKEGDKIQQENGCFGLKLPDHVILNYPLEAPRFLGALRWWPIPKSQKETSCPRVHVYTFARPDIEKSLSAEDVATDIVASHLIPGLFSQELDTFFGCDVDVFWVRDVAPGKHVFCVSFSATTKLLRHMQGDF